MKYNQLTFSQVVEAVLNKIGRVEGVKAFLRGELKVSKPKCRWYEKEGITYFLVTSDGTTGEGWIKRLEKKGFRIGEYAESVLRSPDFKHTNGITTKIAVLRSCLFKGKHKIIKKVHAFAVERKLTAPNAEVACLIREAFSDEEIKLMGFWWIVVMHEFIKDSDGNPILLSAYGADDRSWLGTYYGKPNDRWDRINGFAFVVSQTPSV
jgi:hypothetical protein